MNARELRRLQQQQHDDYAYIVRDLSYLWCVKAMFMCSLLRHTNFSNADLRGANLYYSDLYNSNFSFADLRGADLRGTCLNGTVDHER
jgi:uncharacterized protein YjbI with pentapeptide repeats